MTTQVSVLASASHYGTIGGSDWVAGYTRFGVYSLPSEYLTTLTFAALAVPKGATIVSAIIDQTTSSGGGNPGDPVIVNLYFNNVDNSAEPAANADAEALSLTGAVGWTVGPLSGYQVFYTPDLAAILQTIINRPGWASGNIVTMVGRNNGSANYRYRDGVLAYNAHLVVNYNEAPSAPPFVPKIILVG